ncbi:MAG: hypothetical protein Q4C34_02360 [Bacteroidales bacterium]|nr:hypothetical protein [Bacteroidales bacterium]
MRIAFFSLFATLCAIVAIAITPREAFNRIAGLPGMPAVVTAPSAGEDTQFDIRDISIAVVPELSRAGIDSLAPALNAVIDSVESEYVLTRLDTPDAFVTIAARPDSADRYDMLVFVINQPDSAYDKGTIAAINGNIGLTAFNTIANARVDTTEGRTRIIDSENPDFSIVNF